MSHITKTFPDLIKRETAPTRKGALLDYLFTNFEDQIVLSEVCFPIESSSDKSDHNLVCYKCLLDRPASFAWQTHEYIKITEKGKEKFNQLIRAQDWHSVTAAHPVIDTMVEEFQYLLSSLLSACFS